MFRHLSKGLVLSLLTCASAPAWSAVVSVDDAKQLAADFLSAGSNDFFFNDTATTSSTQQVRRPDRTIMYSMSTPDRGTSLYRLMTRQPLFSVIQPKGAMMQPHFLRQCSGCLPALRMRSRQLLS